jgi:hypothetical protein
MEIGSRVLFSHSFYIGSEGNCFEEDSLTLEGSLAEPEFIVAFKDVSTQ